MASQSETIPLSVTIITLNEEKRLSNCLRSLPRGSEVVILDSGSTDRTRQIAEEFGAKFHTRPFTNHAEQKNAAIDLASQPWILSIDADEVLSEKLAKKITAICRSSAPEKNHAFEVKRKLVFMNKKLNYGKSSDWPIRLFKKSSGRFTSEIHEHVVLSSGSVGRLRESMDHYSYDSLEDYFNRFNWYTNLVAMNRIKTGKSINLFAHVMRPWFEFVNRYLVRGGFLDGYPGYTYALLSSFYTFVKYAKFRELTRPELKPS